MDELGGLARLTHEGVHIDDVVRGLVAVGILSDETADVGLCFIVQLAVGDEEAVEATHGDVATSEQLHEPFDIVRHEP